MKMKLNFITTPYSYLLTPRSLKEVTGYHAPLVYRGWFSRMWTRFITFFKLDKNNATF